MQHPQNGLLERRGRAPLRQAKCLNYRGDTREDTRAAAVRPQEVDERHRRHCRERGRGGERPDPNSGRTAAGTESARGKRRQYAATDDRDHQQCDIDGHEDAMGGRGGVVPHERPMKGCIAHRQQQKHQQKWRISTPRAQ